MGFQKASAVILDRTLKAIEAYLGEKTMGGSSWSDDHYTTKASLRAATKKPVFDYDHKVKAAVARGDHGALKVHDKLNPKGAIRESRDSDAHPESNSIMVLFDVTGSMGVVPVTMQTKLPQLMGLLLRKSYIPHPQILFGAIGDATIDRVPLQIGQFESGIEMDEDITNFVLEGGGGGQRTESYELGMYFAAHRTACDCYEKRGKKGYLFLIGDEKPYPSANRRELEEVLGVKVEANIPIQELAKQVAEKWEAFFIVPNQTSYFHEPWLMETWREIVGPERFLKLDDPNAVCELIGATIGACEGAEIGRIADDLASVGTSTAIVKAVTDAIAPVANGAITKTGTATGLPAPSSSASTNARI